MGIGYLVWLSEIIDVLLSCEGIMAYHVYFDFLMDLMKGLLLLFLGLHLFSPLVNLYRPFLGLSPFALPLLFLLKFFALILL